MDPRGLMPPKPDKGRTIGDCDGDALRLELVEIESGLESPVRRRLRSGAGGCDINGSDGGRLSAIGVVLEPTSTVRSTECIGPPLETEFDSLVPRDCDGIASVLTSGRFACSFE